MKTIYNRPLTWWAAFVLFGLTLGLGVAAGILYVVGATFVASVLLICAGCTFLGGISSIYSYCRGSGSIKKAETTPYANASDPNRMEELKKDNTVLLTPTFITTTQEIQSGNQTKNDTPSEYMTPTDKTGSRKSHGHPDISTQSGKKHTNNTSSTSTTNLLNQLDSSVSQTPTTSSPVSFDEHSPTLNHLRLAARILEDQLNDLQKNKKSSNSESLTSIQPLSSSINGDLLLPSDYDEESNKENILKQKQQEWQKDGYSYDPPSETPSPMPETLPLSPSSSTSPKNGSNLLSSIFSKQPIVECTQQHRTPLGEVTINRNNGNGGSPAAIR